MKIKFQIFLLLLPEAEAKLENVKILSHNQVIERHDLLRLTSAILSRWNHCDRENFTWAVWEFEGSSTTSWGTLVSNGKFRKMAESEINTFKSRDTCELLDEISRLKNMLESSFGRNTMTEASLSIS